LRQRRKHMDSPSNLVIAACTGAFFAFTPGVIVLVGCGSKKRRCGRCRRVSAGNYAWHRSESVNKQASASTSIDERLNTVKLMLDAKLLHEEREHQERVRAIWGEYESESKRIVGEGVQDEL